MVPVGRLTELADGRRQVTGEGGYRGTAGYGRCRLKARVGRPSALSEGRPLPDSLSTPEDMHPPVTRLVSVASAIIEGQTSEQEQEETKEFRETFEKCID